MKHKWCVLTQNYNEKYPTMVDYRYTLIGAICSILFISIFNHIDRYEIRRDIK